MLLLLLLPFAFMTDRLMVGGLTTAIMILVAVWQTKHPRPRPVHGPGHGSLRSQD